MLFTKESDYAIRVIRALQDGGKKTIKELCELEQIPSAFGYKILQKMNKSGLIEIRRGPKGGYQLAKDIGEFTLYDVVTAIEPDLRLWNVFITLVSEMKAKRDVRFTENFLEFSIR